MASQMALAGLSFIVFLSVFVSAHVPIAVDVGCDSSGSCDLSDDVSMFQKIKTRKGFKAMIEPSEAELLEEEPDESEEPTPASLATGGQTKGSTGPKTATVKLASERQPPPKDVEKTFAR
mmetsp:Transcript_51653/g.82057  ORF Transcript_51653/g.82057 Transcript_51653/m.82057 type:complete len:120 (-) Transcript_51653:46-405(-)|eukprot:CAMPEP_0169085154 /NCGR_PEP_ID=MMETSP1015-20121227/13005_1 /TAXON_ID=342587 /ORGANISM="Karlodinium micrum, Strain CCMP2283" /LENGTH=119 /DNA_ID=CAMNT_0009145215 /DNA_START=81 /DNA_END=440 /DNA_ORIENTATION=+